MASQISDSAAVMGRMITDLLDFSATRLGGTMRFSPTSMDLRPLCQEVVDEMQRGFPAHTLRLETRGDLTGEWDAARLRQVISNLLANAIQHGTRNGPVDCIASDEGSEVRLAVHNHGSPIPPSDIATIFEPLARRAGSPDLLTHRQPGSLGLGLYIAKAIVTGHGGSIDVQSSQEDGTIFTFYLPRRRPA